VSGAHVCEVALVQGVTHQESRAGGATIKDATPIVAEFDDKAEPHSTLHTSAASRRPEPDRRAEPVDEHQTETARRRPRPGTELTGARVHGAGTLVEQPFGIPSEPPPWRTFTGTGTASGMPGVLIRNGEREFPAVFCAAA